MVDTLVTGGKLGRVVEGLGYPLYHDGDYHINLIGIRATTRHVNTFNDLLCALFYQHRHQVMLTFPCTTDPGRDCLLQPLSGEGTAIVKPGHYPDVWQLGLHHGKYEALVQRGPISVYRDGNRDDLLDLNENTVETGLFGINLHHASLVAHSTQVGKWSAGCQVLQDGADFAVLLALCQRGATHWGDRFDYTLIDEEELWTGRTWGALPQKPRR